MGEEFSYADRAHLRVYETTLAQTEPWDVFFTTFDPSVVWRRGEPGTGHKFCCLGEETWYRQDYVGNPDTAVIVIHNTKRLTGPAGGC